MKMTEKGPEMISEMMTERKRQDGSPQTLNNISP